MKSAFWFLELRNALHQTFWFNPSVAIATESVLFVIMASLRKKFDPMQRAIPRNPRYEDIKPTLDTGASMSKYIQRMEEFRESKIFVQLKWWLFPDYRVRDDEIFKRMKMPTFVQLIIQVNQVKEQCRPINSTTHALDGNSSFGCVVSYIGNKHEITSGNLSDGISPTHSGGDIKNPPATARSTLQSLIGGVGEYDTYLKSQFPDRPLREGVMKPATDGEQPYLLLDVRDRDEYDQCHIISALNYPIAMLSRSVNFETPEMLAFRNKPGHIIIIYDEDERIAPRAATTLVQRGYCNLFLLSGGLKVAWKQFPEGLIIGEMPDSIRQVLQCRPRDRRNSSSNRLNSASSTTRTCLTTSTLGYASTVRSRGSTPTVYCTIGSRDMPYGFEDFLAEDIIKLNLQLEKGVGDGRSIRSGYARSTISSMRHSELSGKKPFRC
ncbi:Centrosomal protein of 41 kDa B [Fasciola gigantica]|uniref:Centrosomal protein of 41 kDa B n=1 Tax=Fasciola gigantica TaxID=46835 RepID=A0A504YJ95_FASGI|nr:Centrosomal protein of 41 kDa B [Fasciola gigantica]